jgi:deoxyadenosine/deoxycytidine kinase
VTGRSPAQGSLLVGVVGVCAAGKSTLVSMLRERGFQVRHIAQEHSYVQDMWKRIADPDVLIYLDASFPVTVARRALNWYEADWAEQQRRLMHARQHADLYIQTDRLTPEEVLVKVLGLLEDRRRQ